jgi:hypothetical protein
MKAAALKTKQPRTEPPRLDDPFKRGQARVGFPRLLESALKVNAKRGLTARLTLTSSAPKRAKAEQTQAKQGHERAR